MAIGKFNFASLRAANEMAAWIFFAFSSNKRKKCRIESVPLVSVVVNMILINMMMAIINMAFEDIKAEKSAYKSKFAIIDYIKRTTKEMTGIQ